EGWIVERVANRIAVRRILVRRERRGRRDEERRVADVAPVLVQRDVLEDLVVVPAVPATRDGQPVSAHVVRDADARTEVVLVELAFALEAKRLQPLQRNCIELVAVRAGLHFVSDAEIQRQVRIRLPIVLYISR